MSATLSPVPKLQFFDANGAPLVGGKLYSYIAGTTTPLSTYTDSTGTTSNTNPVILDARGEAGVWLADDSFYKLALYTADNVLVWTVDQIASNTTLAALAASGGSALIGYLPSGTGAVATTVQTKLRETVSVKDFGAVGDGVTDDTLALISAMAYCRSAGKTLLLEGDIRFVAATVPSGSKVAGYGGDYVNACSMVGANAAQLSVVGKIGFNTTGVNRTIIENIRVVTTSRQLTESEQENTCPYVFAALSGTKTFASYRNLEIAPTVTDLTGAYRTGALIQEFGVANLVVENLKATNTTRAFTAYTCTDVSVRDVWLENTECGVYLSTVTNYLIDGISLTNTQSQYGKWVARTGTPARLVNGMDALLVEYGSKGQVCNIDATWPIERAAYIQSRDVECANGKVLNGDGFKLVGTDRNNQANNVFADNLHVTLNPDFTLGVGREGVAAVKTYYSNSVYVNGCTAAAYAPTFLSLLGVLNFGGYPQTIDTITVRNSHGINAQAIAYGVLMTQTAAQLAVIDPAQTFLTAKKVSIEDCSLVKCQVRLFGSVLHMRDNDASADAKATYALQTFSARRNTVNLDSSSGVDDWLFDFRYLDGATTENHNVNLPFLNSFPASVLGTAGTTYRNILMREPNLKFSTGTSTLVANFANMTVLRGTVLTFTGNLAETGLGDLLSTVDTYVYVSGLLSDGSKKITLEGKGYYLHNTAIDCGIEMNASGNFYLGKAISGTKTDQVSTPPITTTVAAGNLQIRGDLSPTVRYTAKLTIV